MKKKFLYNENRRNNDASEYIITAQKDAFVIKPSFEGDKAITVPYRELEYPMLTSKDALWNEIKSQIMKGYDECRNLIILYTDEEIYSLQMLANANCRAFG